jgi:hypothetical protein
MRRWLLAPLLALIAAGCADNPYGIVHDPPPDSWPGVTYNSTPPTLTNLQGVNLQADVNGNLKVNVASGGGSGGTSSSFGSAFPATGTAAGAKSSGGNMAALNLDSSGNLYIDCNVGCAGGSSSNASSGVATSSTNGQTIAWGYAFNGTTWDQIQDDASKNLKVAIENTPTVTANAGTNLNTSALALESGGNLATLAGGVSVSVYQTNMKQVNGVTTLTGAGASGTGAQRVTASQDTTTIAGSAPGTAGSPSSNVVSVQGVASGTTLPVTAAQATASNLNAQVQGPAASGASVSGNPVLEGLRAQNAENTAVSNGQAVDGAGDLTGKTITSPYANRENYVRGAASATGTGATTIIAAQGASVKTYITDLECGRSDAGTSAIIVTFSDAASTVLVIPNSGGGGGNNKTFNVPLVTAANTAFTFTAGSGVTTLYCDAQGYTGY